MTVQYMNFGSGAQGGSAPTTSEGANSASQSTPATPVSAPHMSNINDNQVEIKNPFAEPTIKETGQVQSDKTSPSSNSASGNTPPEKRVTFEEIVNQKQFGEMTKEIFDKVAEGDMTGFNSSLQTFGRMIYKTAVEDANTVIDSRLKAFEDKFTRKLDAGRNTREMVTALKNAVPLANDAAIEPIAQQVLAGFLKQGMSKSEALGATNNYFNSLASRVSESNKQSEVEKKFDSLDALFS